MKKEDMAAIKKCSSPAKTHISLTGKRASCGLIIPSYLSHKYEFTTEDTGYCVVLIEEADGIFIKKLIL